MAAGQKGAKARIGAQRLVPPCPDFHSFAPCRAHPLPAAATFPRAAAFGRWGKALSYQPYAIALLRAGKKTPAADQPEGAPMTRSRCLIRFRGKFRR